MDIKSYKLPQEVIDLISKQAARIKSLEDGLRELVNQADPIDDRWNYMAAIEKAKQLLNK